MLITLLIQKYMNRWARWSESAGMRDKFDSLKPPNMSGFFQDHRTQKDNRGPFPAATILSSLYALISHREDGTNRSL